MILLSLLSACTPFKADVEFARTFIRHLKSHDPAMAADMAPSLIAIAGSWQVIDSTMKDRMPASDIDSAVFVSREIKSEWPPTVRRIKLNLFGRGEYSVADVALETEKDGRTLVNTIAIAGPLPLR
jgi:hypothetical protein